MSMIMSQQHEKVAHHHETERYHVHLLADQKKGGVLPAALHPLVQCTWPRSEHSSTNTLGQGKWAPQLKAGYTHHPAKGACGELNPWAKANGRLSSKPVIPTTLSSGRRGPAQRSALLSSSARSQA